MNLSTKPTELGLSGGPTPRKNTSMRWLLTIVGVVLVLGLLVAIKGAQIGTLIGFGKQYEKDGPPPEAVSSAVVGEEEWEGSLTSVGSVASAKGVSLSADAQGTVTRISFESGQTVKVGDVLVEIDTKVERAQLATAIARRELATTTINRTRQLAKTGAISAAQLDADESALTTSTTEVAQIEAQIAKKTVRAPFAGKLGIRQVNLGQYLQPGTPITVLESVDAVHVDFQLPQQRLADLKVGQPVRIHLEGADAPGVDAGPGEEIEGNLAAIDPQVDPVTRALKLRADITKRAEQLRPGMFVEVSVVLPEKKGLLVVPATAVVHAPYGDSIFLVEPKQPGSPGLDKTQDGKVIKIARQQFVRVGQTRGDFIAVLEGVKVKDEVVTQGAFKLRNNAPITVDNSKALKPSLNPHPENR